MHDEREEITKEKEESDILLSAEETSREKYANTFPESRARNEISIILEFEQRIVSIRFSILLKNKRKGKKLTKVEKFVELY